jgi:hypothetical protein
MSAFLDMSWDDDKSRNFMKDISYSLFICECVS